MRRTSSLVSGTMRCRVSATGLSALARCAWAESGASTAVPINSIASAARRVRPDGSPAPRTAAVFASRPAYADIVVLIAATTLIIPNYT
jgi:hypothetical protein